MIKLTSVRIPLLSFFSNLKCLNIYNHIYFNLIWISFKTFSVFLFSRFFFFFFFFFSFILSEIYYMDVQLQYDEII